MPVVARTVSFVVCRCKPLFGEKGGKEVRVAGCRLVESGDQPFSISDEAAEKINTTRAMGGRVIRNSVRRRENSIDAAGDSLRSVAGA